jgi:hypothetical protein
MDEEDWVIVGRPSLSVCSDHPHCWVIRAPARMSDGDGTVTDREFHFDRESARECGMSLGELMRLILERLR